MISFDVIKCGSCLDHARIISRYCVAGICLLLVSAKLTVIMISVSLFCQCCGIYYWLWIIFLPKRGGYEIVEEIEESPEGARNTKLTRRYHKSSADEGEQQPLLVTT